MKPGIYFSAFQFFKVERKTLRDLQKLFTIRLLKTFVWSFVSALVFSTSASGHPVSFKSSFGIMGYHSPILTHNSLNYSLEHWFAIAAHHFRRPDLEQNNHASAITANFLVKRWNGDRFQANIYANLGLGQSELSSEPEPIGLGLLQFDIEDRDYYFLAKFIELRNEDNFEMRQSVVRAGLSPYVEPFDGLHSWFILEYLNTEFIDRSRIEDLTPYLRLFYRNLLFELGQSFEGVTRFNYIMHF